MRLPAGVSLRPLADGDASALLDAYQRNQEHLAPTGPLRPPSFYTLDGQRARLNALLRQAEDGVTMSYALVRDGTILGCATLNSIERGIVSGATLGYWIDQGEVRRGLATATVAAICRIADDDLRLHRIVAGTAPANIASQAVLLRNGFEQFGYAHQHLFIAGRWGDAKLYEKVLNDRPPPL